MKRILSLLALLVLLSGALCAENVPYSSLVPKTAKSMAMGGVFTAVPTSEFSFFGNPAGFASKKSTLMFPSVDAWAYFRPTGSNISTLAASDSSSFMTNAFNLMAQNGGTGGGASVGMGFVLKGLGVGLFATTDEYAEGSSPASGVLHSETELSSIIGLGLPIQLGDLRLNVGGDLRPFYRISLQDVALTTVIDNPSPDKLYADAFFGVAMDLGATLQLGPVTLGLSLRDIAPSYAISSDTLTNVLASLQNGALPAASANANAAVFTPNVTAGLAWSPKVAPGLFDPTLYFELQNPVSVFKEGAGIGSALNLIHTGAELKFLNFIMLRGGLNRGWLSAGAGLKLLFIDLNAAVFTEELGALPGDKPRSGLAIQAAIRF